MKKIFFLLALSMLSVFVQAQTAKHDTAMVAKVRGIPVFVMCEPAASYEVVANVSDDDAVSILNAISGDNTYRTIKESCSVIINNAQRKQKKGKFTFDAVIISDDGHTGTCIKFN